MLPMSKHCWKLIVTDLDMPRYKVDEGKVRKKIETPSNIGKVGKRGMITEVDILYNWNEVCGYNMKNI